MSERYGKFMLASAAGLSQYSGSTENLQKRELGFGCSLHTINSRMPKCILNVPKVPTILCAESFLIEASLQACVLLMTWRWIRLCRTCLRIHPARQDPQEGD